MRLVTGQELKKNSLTHTNAGEKRCSVNPVLQIRRQACLPYGTGIGQIGERAWQFSDACFEQDGPPCWMRP